MSGTPQAARPGERVARTDDGAQVLYDELMVALRARGLAVVHHPCPHCGKLAEARLLDYPEVRMAAADAVAAFCREIARIVQEREAEIAVGKVGAEGPA